MKQKFTLYQTKIRALFLSIIKDQNKAMLLAALAISLFLSLIINMSKPVENTDVPEYLQGNLEVFLPEGYVLYPIEIDNYEAINGLIGATAYVRVYSSETGKSLAKNIKVLRAPKSPDQLAFIIPVNIAKLLVQEGPSFRLAVQKKTNDSPVMTNKLKLNKKTLTTYGS